MADSLTTVVVVGMKRISLGGWPTRPPYNIHPCDSCKKKQTWSPWQYSPIHACIILLHPGVSPCTWLHHRPLCQHCHSPCALITAICCLHHHHHLHFIPLKPTSPSSLLHSYKAFTPAPFHSNTFQSFTGLASYPIKLYLFRVVVPQISSSHLPLSRHWRKIQQQCSSCVPYFLRIQSSACRRRRNQQQAAAAVAVGFRALLRAEAAASAAAAALCPPLLQHLPAPDHGDIFYSSERPKSFGIPPSTCPSFFFCSS